MGKLRGPESAATVPGRDSILKRCTGALSRCLHDLACANADDPADRDADDLFYREDDRRRPQR